MAMLDPSGLYAQLHPLAELSGKEEKTAAFIAARLAELGIEARTGVGGHGVLATIRGTEPGPAVLFRADMDALPFTEPDGREIAVHACGHDSHCAMLLAAASHLRDKIRRGTLKLLFQPAEETVSGALAVAEDGALEGVDIAIGAHIRPQQDMAPGQASPAVTHLACVTAEVTLRGKAAHAARPHLGVNPLDEAMSYIGLVNSFRYNPGETWSVKPTRFKCEEGATNTLANWAKVIFDIRAATAPTLRKMMNDMKLGAQRVAESYGGSSGFEVLDYCPAPDYDPQLVALLGKIISEELGQDKLAPPCGGGGEDFHFFKEKYPSLRTAYFGVGVGAAPGLHDRHMSFDPKYLANGVRIWVRLAEELLG